MAKQIAIKESTDKKLAELSKIRKEKGSICKFKQDILDEAVEALYRKEIKKGNKHE